MAAMRLMATWWVDVESSLKASGTSPGTPTLAATRSRSMKAAICALLTSPTGAKVRGAAPPAMARHAAQAIDPTWVAAPDRSSNGAGGTEPDGQAVAVDRMWGTPKSM